MCLGQAEYEIVFSLFTNINCCNLLEIELSYVIKHFRIYSSSVKYSLESAFAALHIPILLRSSNLVGSICL